MKGLKIVATTKPAQAGGSLASSRKSFNVVNENGELVLIQKSKPYCKKFIEVNGE